MKYLYMGLLGLFLFSGCAQLSIDEKNAARSKIDLIAQQTIDALVKKNAQIPSEIKNAEAYAVVNWKVTKVPLVGAGGGNGVIVNTKTGERKYFNLTRFDFGGGWGVKSFKNLLLINDKELMQRAMKKGDFKFEVGAEVAAGTAGVDGGSGQLAQTKTKSYMLLDGGASATVTTRLLYYTMDNKLNN